MMNKHKVTFEVIVGEAVPTCDDLLSTIERVNKEIRLEFALRDWYAEIKSVQIEKIRSVPNDQ